MCVCVGTVVLNVSDSDGCRNAFPEARPHTHAPSSNQKIILLLFYVDRVENADCRRHAALDMASKRMSVCVTCQEAAVCFISISRVNNTHKKWRLKNNKIIFIVTIINKCWERCRIPSIYVRSHATLLTAKTTWGRHGPFIRDISNIGFRSMFS